MIRAKETSRRVAAASVCALALMGLGATGAHAEAPSWKVLAATGPTHLPPVTSEVQRLTVDATGGSFTISYEGQPTGALPFDAAAAQVEVALDALPAIAGAGGTVKVGGGPGNAGGENPYSVRFDGGLAGVDVPALTTEASGLTGGAGTATVTTVTPGLSRYEGGDLAVTASNVGAAPAGGALTLTVGPLPAGIETRSVVKLDPATFGTWNCPAAGEGTTLECSYSAAVPATENSPTVKIPLTVKGGLAPETATLPVTVSGGGAGTDTYEVPLVVSSGQAGPGVAAIWAGAFDEDGQPEAGAGAHPHTAATAFWLNSTLAPNGNIVPAGALRTASAALPAGFVGSPLVTQKRCPQHALDSSEGSFETPLCTIPASGIGELFAALNAWNDAALGGSFAIPNPIFNDVPAFGTAAEFGVNVNLLGHAYLVGSVRSAEDFGVDVTSFNTPGFTQIFGNAVFLEGFPAGAAGKAFLRNPTSCSLQQQEAAAGTGPLTTLAVNSWSTPDPKTMEDEVGAKQPPVEDCAPLTAAWVGNGPEPAEEKPSFSFQPNVTQASSGTGATAHLHIPQRGLTDAARLGTSDLKKTTVVLPPGLTLNPSAANGLQACSEAEIGFIGSGFPEPNPIRFNEAAPACPEASKLGNVRIKTPLLEEELEGTIYLAAQDANPFNSLLALYLVVESERFGLTLKLPGKVTPDPNTGQLTAVFDNNPQVPFEDLTLNFRGGGPRSQLATPALCGSYKTTGSLTPWSAESESSIEAAQIDEPGFSVSSGPGGTRCVTNAAGLPFSPGFEAGTASTAAGAYAPLVIKLRRNDGEQELKRLDFTLPAGVTAKLAGIPYCSEAAIAAASGKPGKAELAAPSCPSASRIGSVDTAAGVGSEPVHVGGSLYLAGPYGGAPLSSVVITPAVAGPFDLGNVVVRAPLFVNPETAQITVRSDEIPHILKGISLKVRSVQIVVDRPEFSLNPTSCEQMVVSGQVTGITGGVANVSNRFQVGNCEALGFKPNLKLTYKGASKRTGNPALRAVLTQRAGQANISRTVVVLPKGSIIDQSHVNNPCTRAQYAENACPAKSILGTATAWSPLLDEPLTGKVYFRSNGGARTLPDIVASLKGQVDIELVGFIDAVQNKKAGTSRVRNTFAIVPDAPVSRFELNMKGGKLGLIENSKNLCRQKNRATVKMGAHNGLALTTKPVVKTSCGKKAKNAKKRKK